jgi:hypothetical protein
MEAAPRLFQYKEQVWSGFHYSHAYLESMQSRTGLRILYRQVPA